MTESANGIWPFGRGLHTELGVKIRIARKTTNIGKDGEDCKGQRLLWRSNIGPCRPRLEMHPPGEEEKGKRKWKRKI